MTIKKFANFGPLINSVPVIVFFLATEVFGRKVGLLFFFFFFLKKIKGKRK